MQLASAQPLAGRRVALLDDDGATSSIGWWSALLGATVDAGPPASPGCISVGRADTAADIAFTAPATGAQDDADWEGLALWARSGLAWLTRTVQDSTGGGEPRAPTVPLVDELAGATAMIGLLAQEIQRRREGRADQVGVDKLEALALLPMQPVAVAQLVDDPPVPPSTAGVFQAADGTVYVRVVEPAQWRRLLERVGLPGLAAAVETDPTVVARNAEVVDRAIAAWVATGRARDLVHLGQAERIPMAVVAEPREVRGDPQMRERAFLDGAGNVVRAPWIERASSAPLGGIGSDGRAAGRPARPASGLPLEGVRVLDLTWAWAGPFASTMLADLGADVINVELEPRASNLRVQLPGVDTEGVDGGGWWSANQRGKASIGVDLKHPVGRAAILELASLSDLVLENFSAGVVDRLGVGPDDLWRVNPSIGYVSLSAFGASGPCAHYLGYGTQLHAASGFAYLAATGDGRPSLMGIPTPDPMSGLVGAIAALTALLQAQHERVGRHLDVSELEATCAMLRAGLGDEPVATRYRVVGGGDDWCLERDGHRQRVATIAEALADPYLVERGFWQPDLCLERHRPGLRIAGAPFVVGGRRPVAWRGAPRLFEDTRAVFDAVLGWESSRVRDAIEAGALRAS